MPSLTPAPALMSKAASALAEQAPLLDRAPLRNLATALKYGSFKSAMAFAYPTATQYQQTQLAIKLATQVVKLTKAGGSCSAGASPVSSMMPQPKVVSPMSFNGSPATGKSFGKQANSWRNILPSVDEAVGAPLAGAVAGGMVGTPIGAVRGAMRGNTAEGAGRGLIRGGMAGAGMGLGGMAARAMGRAMPETMAGHPMLSTALNAAGMLGGGALGYMGSGAMLGEPHGDGSEEEDEKKKRHPAPMY